MALLGASFQIGRSALAAYQSALAVSGQNIANLANPDYTRQTGRLTALVGGPVLGGVAPGAGVRLSQLQRHVDEAIENRLRLASGQRSAADVIQRTLAQTEAQQNELTEQDLSTQLTELLASFAQLQTEPQDSSRRNLTVATADAVIASMQRQRSGLIQQVRDLNVQAISQAQRVSTLAGEVAKLNTAIVVGESDGVSVASALRDQRDAQIRELAQLVDVQVREQPNGGVNLYIGSEPLVEFNRSRGLTVQTTLEDGLEISSVRFADNNGTVLLTGGSLAGIVQSRDRNIVGELNRLDQLARGLIYEVNRAHSTGVGTVGYSSITSAYAVDDPDAVLSSDAAGLPFPLRNGVLILKVRDVDTGQISTTQIEVDLDGLNGDDDTLATLAAALNGVTGFSASVTSDNRLALSADSGREFWFSEDSSGALAALGVGGFFVGQDATTIDVNPAIRADTRLIATSAGGALNDGGVAGRIAQLADPTAISALLDNQSIGDFHNTSVNRLAVAASAAFSDLEAADTIYNGLFAQREAISGVSLDEEAINLTKYERAYQGATRYIGVLDQLSNELLALVQ